jgi:hypothetical protein
MRDGSVSIRRRAEESLSDFGNRFRRGGTGMQLSSGKGTICGVFLRKNGVTEHHTLELHLLVRELSPVYLASSEQQ